MCIYIQQCIIMFMVLMVISTVSYSLVNSQFRFKYTIKLLYIFHVVKVSIYWHIERTKDSQFKRFSHTLLTYMKYIACHGGYGIFCSLQNQVDFKGTANNVTRLSCEQIVRPGYVDRDTIYSTFLFKVAI